MERGVSREKETKNKGTLLLFLLLMAVRVWNKEGGTNMRGRAPFSKKKTMPHKIDRMVGARRRGVKQPIRDSLVNLVGQKQPRPGIFSVNLKDKRPKLFYTFLPSKKCITYNRPNGIVGKDKAGKTQISKIRTRTFYLEGTIIFPSPVTFKRVLA